jgi:hypothetical protein
MEEMRNAYKMLVRRPEVKRPIRRPRHILEVNIRMDLRETGAKLCTGFIWLRIGTGGGLL